MPMFLLLAASVSSASVTYPLVRKYQFDDVAAVAVVEDYAADDDDVAAALEQRCGESHLLVDFVVLHSMAYSSAHA